MAFPVRSLYYQAPPQESPNAMASMVSGFLQVRLPWARDLFNARLQALQANDQDKVIDNLMQLRTRLAEQRNQYLRVQREIARDQMSTVKDIYRANLDYMGKQEQIAGSLAEARTKQETERMKLGVISNPRRQELLANAEGVISGLASQVEGLIGSPGDSEKVLNQLEHEVKQQARLFEQSGADANEVNAYGQLLEEHARSVFGSMLGAKDDPGRTKLGQMAMMQVRRGLPTTQEGAPIRQHGVRRGTPEEAIGRTRQAMEELGIPGGERLRVTEGGRLAIPRADPEADPEVGRLAAAESAIDDLIARVANRDPFGGLGGFFDPLPVSPRQQAGIVARQAGRGARRAERRPSGAAEIREALTAPAEAEEAAPTRAPERLALSPRQRAGARPVLAEAGPGGIPRRALPEPRREREPTQSRASRIREQLELRPPESEVELRSPAEDVLAPVREAEEREERKRPVSGHEVLGLNAPTILERLMAGARVAEAPAPTPRQTQTQEMGFLTDREFRALVMKAQAGTASPEELERLRRFQAAAGAQREQQGL